MASRPCEFIATMTIAASIPMTAMTRFIFRKMNLSCFVCFILCVVDLFTFFIIYFACFWCQVFFVEETFYRPVMSAGSGALQGEV